jgi:hypothetical protein
MDDNFMEDEMSVTVAEELLDESSREVQNASFLRKPQEGSVGEENGRKSNNKTAHHSGAEEAEEACRLVYTVTGRGDNKKELLSCQGSLSVDGTAHWHALNFDLEITSVPSYGSCWAHAVLRTVSTLDIVLLRSLPDVPRLKDTNIDWTFFFESLEKWREFGRESMKSNKTSLFMQHVARQLLAAQNEAKCRKWIVRLPSIGDWGDGGMLVAIAAANSLGLVYDINNTVHKWAIAILLENTQCSSAVMRAILQVDFGGRFSAGVSSGVG